MGGVGCSRGAQYPARTGEEAVLPGHGSRARGQRWAMKRCPFGGSVALPWLSEMVECVCLRSLDAQPIHQLPMQLLTV